MILYYLVIQFLNTTLLVLYRRCQHRYPPSQSHHLLLQLLSINLLTCSPLQNLCLVASRLEEQSHHRRPQTRLLADRTHELLPRRTVLHPLLDDVHEIKRKVLGRGGGGGGVRQRRRSTLGRGGELSYGPGSSLAFFKVSCLNPDSGPGSSLANNLHEPSSVEKIMEIDEHIGCAMSGLIADARTPVEHSHVETQNHRFSYGEPMMVESTTQAICDLALRFGE